MNKINTVAKAIKYANKKNKELIIYDFLKSALIQHDDGSVLFFNCSLVESLEFYWIVYSEHKLPQVFRKNDVRCWICIEQPYKRQLL